MKRRLFKLAWFLILGAVVNVALSCGCVFLSRTYESLTLQTTKNRDGDTHEILSFKAFGSEYVELTSKAFALDMRRQDLLSEEVISSSPFDWSRLRRIGPKEFILYHEGAHGWPLYCFRWSFRWSKTYRGIIKGGFEFGQQSKIQVKKRGSSNSVQFPLFTVVPYLPIWKGLIINTIFYAVFLWALTFGPFTARRFIRGKRGRCIKCGYDLRGAEHEVCPECGWVREIEA